MKKSDYPKKVGQDQEEVYVRYPVYLDTYSFMPPGWYSLNVEHDGYSLGSLIRYSTEEECAKACKEYNTEIGKFTDEEVDEIVSASMFDNWEVGII